jgi:hypothetical protein
MEKKPNELEIYRMHDIIQSILSEEFPVSLDQEDKVTMLIVLNVLCWILGHDRGNIFLENMVRLEADLAMGGIVFKGIEPNEPTKKS